MDIQSLKDMVACFCDTILEIKDASEFEFDKNKNKFFINYGQTLKEKSLKSDLKLHQDALFVFLNSYCFKYIESHLTKVNNAFYFYEKNKMEAYRSGFLTHLQNYTTAQTVTDFFEWLFDWIDNIQKEYMINVVQVGKKIDEKNSFNEKTFNKKLEEYKSELTDQKTKYEILKQQIDDSQSVLNEVKQKAESIDIEILKAEYAQNDRLHAAEKNMIQTSISILGVFAAVVLTFNMGISFAAESLETFMQSGIYHSVLVILLFGFIIGNVIFALFAFLKYIHNKNENKEDKKDNFRNTILWEIVKIFNITLLILFICNLICWRIGIVECRDNDIRSTYYSEQSSQQNAEDATEAPTIEETEQDTVAQ